MSQTYRFNTMQNRFVESNTDFSKVCHHRPLHAPLANRYATVGPRTAKPTTGTTVSNCESFQRDSRAVIRTLGNLCSRMYVSLVAYAIDLFT